jgi:hypothetical protein
MLFAAHLECLPRSCVVEHVSNASGATHHARILSSRRRSRAAAREAPSWSLACQPPMHSAACEVEPRLRQRSRSTPGALWYATMLIPQSLEHVRWRSCGDCSKDSPLANTVVPSPAAPQPLMHVRAQSSRCRLAVSTPTGLVAHSSAALQSDRHVRRAAPNTPTLQTTESA